MVFDNEQQRTNVMACINVAASVMRVDASDAMLAQHTALVRLRQEVEAASIAGA